MNPFDDGGNVLVEVVEIGDYLDEAEIDEGVAAPNDAAVHLLLPARPR